MTRTRKTLTTIAATAALLAGGVTAAAPANALPPVGGYGYVNYWDGKDRARIVYKVTSSHQVKITSVRFETYNQASAVELKNTKIYYHGLIKKFGILKPYKTYYIALYCPVPCSARPWTQIDPPIGSTVTFNPYAKTIR